MLQDIVAAGTTSYTGARLRVIDSTDGTPETGFAYDTSGIDLWYQRQGAVRTAITEVTRATVDAAYASGGVIHVSDGYVRLDLPDAALAAGATFVDFGGVATGMVIIGGRIKLTAGFSFADAVRAGLTALPNAAAEAAGGLYTRGTGAGQINQTGNGLISTDVIQISSDATAADNAELMFDGTGYAGGTARLKVDVDTIKTNPVVNAGTVTFPTSATLASTTNITAGTVAVASSVTAVAAGGITNASFAADVGSTALATNMIGKAAEKAVGVAGLSLSAIPTVAAVTTVATTTNLTNLPAAAATAAELAKVPKSDSNVTWNATALASINAEVDTALNTAIPGSPTADSINERIVAIDAFGAPPAVGAIADAVWDEVVTTGAHDTATFAGKQLLTASSAGDPWGTALPGAYGAGTAGKIVGDNLNAPVGTVDTVVDGLATTLGVAGAGLTGLPAVRLANGAHGGAAATLALGGAGGMTGAVTGNLSGSVGSVTGAVGSVTGAVGSVTGAVGSVTGAVGSVTGNVGGNVAGSVGSVTGAVGSVTGAVGSVTAGVAVAVGGIDATAFAAGAIDAAAIAANAIGSAEVADGAITAAKIANAAIDQATFAADVYVVANVKKINDTTLTGNGSSTAWGPA